MINSKTGAMTRNLVLAIAVGLLALGSGAVAAGEGEPTPRGLFAESSVRGSIDRSAEPTVIRSRPVELNLDLLMGTDGMPHDLAPGGSTLALNFFDDATLTAVLNSVEQTYGGGFAWTGRLQDEPLSLVTLAVNDGVMAGTVLSPAGVFEISYAGNGVHAVSEIDQSAFPPEAEPIRVDPPEGELGDVVPETVADDGSIIDVMVVYTPAARSAALGTDAMESLIDEAIIQTNGTYASSQISQRLRLVHTAEVSYTESGNIRTDLDRLRDTEDDGDYYMNIVHTWRNNYGADEVALIVEYPWTYPYCGIAYLMDWLSTGFESYAFATIALDCATGNLSFAHELGHNMGANHDWYVNESTLLYNYSHGKVNVYDGWYTLMSYIRECAEREYSCWRIPYWSNPNLSIAGDPLGVPGGTSINCQEGVFDPDCDADNHRTLNESAWTVANFRQSVVESPPDAPTDLVATAVSPVQINLAWTDNSSDEDGFQIDRSLTGVSWSSLTSVAANTTSYSNAGLTPSTTYYYRVLAYNNNGDSDYSNVASATTPDAIIGPLVYAGVAIDDDNAGGTVGNDNGVLNCEETVKLTVFLKNEGNTAVEGISSILERVGGDGFDDIYAITNEESGYPDIPGGAIEGNLLPFAFSVKPMEEFAHWVDFRLAIEALNWGPSSVDFSLPILCADNAAHRFYLPLISK